MLLLFRCTYPGLFRVENDREGRRHYGKPDAIRTTSVALLSSCERTVLGGASERASAAERLLRAFFRETDAPRLTVHPRLAFFFKENCNNEDSWSTLRGIIEL